MTTNSPGVQEDSFTPVLMSQTDFSKLTKTELVEGLKYAEYMMIHMHAWYRKDSLRPASHPFFRDYERGYTAAMEMALEYLRRSPDHFRKDVS